MYKIKGMLQKKEKKRKENKENFTITVIPLWWQQQETKATDDRLYQTKVHQPEV